MTEKSIGRSDLGARHRGELNQKRAADRSTCWSADCAGWEVGEKCVGSRKALARCTLLKITGALDVA